MLAEFLIGYYLAGLKTAHKLWSYTQVLTHAGGEALLPLCKINRTGHCPLWQQFSKQW